MQIVYVFYSMMKYKNQLINNINNYESMVFMLISLVSYSDTLYALNTVNTHIIRHTH